MRRTPPIPFAPTESTMPPRHVIAHLIARVIAHALAHAMSRRTRQAASPVRYVDDPGWPGRLAFALALVMLGVAPRTHAQLTSPGPTSVDSFHQPCVAVSGIPRAAPGDTPRRMQFHGQHGQHRAEGSSVVVGKAVRKRYIELDDRCASAPAFAPTRDVDSTSVWYVDTPAGHGYALSQHAGKRTLPGVTS
jgi:hypothetical protein